MRISCWRWLLILSNKGTYRIVERRIRERQLYLSVFCHLSWFPSYQSSGVFIFKYKLWIFSLCSFEIWIMETFCFWLPGCHWTQLCHISWQWVFKVESLLHLLIPVPVLRFVKYFLFLDAVKKLIPTATSDDVHKEIAACLQFAPFSKGD